jgi:hypothetical protein
MTHKMAFEALDRTLRDIVPAPSSANTKSLLVGKLLFWMVTLGKLCL